MAAHAGTRTLASAGPSAVPSSLLPTHRPGRPRGPLRPLLAAASPDGDPTEERDPRPSPGFRMPWKPVARLLASLPLALAEMAVVAGLSATGTLVEQGLSPEAYAAKYPGEVLGVPWATVIAWTGADHMYSAPLFLFFCAALSASLAACTATRQLPLARVSQRSTFLRSEAPYRALPYARRVRKELQALEARLRADGFKVTVERGALYAHRGLISRLAPIGVHASLLLIIAGAAYGGLTGAKGNILIPEGQAFVVGPTLQRSGALFGGLLPDTVINVNDFRIEYNEKGDVDQFYSDLSVLEGVAQGQEREVLRETIYVNKPLQYRGVTVYQSDWDIVGLRVLVAPAPAADAPPAPDPVPGETLETAPVYRMVALPGKGKSWGAFVPAPGQPPPAPGQRPRGVTILAADFQQVVLYDNAGQFAGVRLTDSGRPIDVEGMRLTIGPVIGATGLELKADPGVPLVYAGFAGCLVTSIVSLWPHRQVWATQREADGGDGDLLVGARTNRDQIGFTQQLDEALQGLP